MQGAAVPCHALEVTLLITSGKTQQQKPPSHGTKQNSADYEKDAPQLLISR
jgi:hypothetical protein